MGLEKLDHEQIRLELALEKFWRHYGRRVSERRVLGHEAESSGVTRDTKRSDVGTQTKTRDVATQTKTRDVATQTKTRDVATQTGGNGVATQKKSSDSGPQKKGSGLTTQKKSSVVEPPTKSGSDATQTKSGGGVGEETKKSIEWIVFYSHTGREVRINPNPEITDKERQLVQELVAECKKRKLNNGAAGK